LNSLKIFLKEFLLRLFLVLFGKKPKKAKIYFPYKAKFLIVDLGGTQHSLNITPFVQIVNNNFNSSITLLGSKECYDVFCNNPFIEKVILFHKDYRSCLKSLLKLNKEKFDVIVVSHDRHFLNNVCTHIVDIDFGKAKMYVGNYDFWKESSELMLRLINDQNKKAEDKIAELKSFIARFSSNASKAKQATSRKKMLDKINIEDIQPSSRRYPFVGFIPDREVGKDILRVEGISKTVDGVKVLNNVTFIVNKDDKIVFLSDNEIARTTLFQILMGEIEPDEGTFTWGVTTTTSYLPKDNGKFFNGVELNLVEWLRQYSKDDDESYIRGFLGKMLFSGEEALKKAHVLSGGEKVRCMLSRMMLSGANVIVLDEPTNHLDLESITAVNDGLIAYKGNVLFSSHDHKFIETVANRIIELTPNGIVDRMMEFDEWLANDELQETIKGMYE